MGKIKKLGPYLIVAAALLWGVDGILRRSLFDLPPIIIVFYEHLVGLVILAPYLIKNIAKLKFSKKEWAALIVVSLLSGVLATLWFTSALIKVNYISFSVVFLLQKLQPIFATVFAVLFLRERITKKYIWWAGLALVSAYFVTFPGGWVDLSTGQGTIMAAILALGAAFAWGSSTAFSRFVLLRHPHTVVTGMRFLLTSIIAFVLLIFMGQAAALTRPDISQWLRFVLIALTTGMVALWIYYKGLKNTQVKIATILELTFPLMAVLIDIFLYKNYLAPSQYIAAAFLWLAMYMVSRLNVSFDKSYRTSVIAGAGRGRRIGFPTLNFIVPEKFEHSYGIYCGWVNIGSNRYKAAFHYGPIPTFSEKQASLEAYILEGQIADIDGQASFQFKAKLRDIKKFANTGKLADTIDKDIKRSKKILQ